MGAGIGHVAGDIEKILSQPNYSAPHATRINGATEMPCDSEGKGKLEQRAPIDSRPLAENTHQRVTRFVQRQICAVQHRKPAFGVKPMKTERGNTKCKNQNQPDCRN